MTIKKRTIYETTERVLVRIYNSGRENTPHQSILELPIQSIDGQAQCLFTKSDDPDAGGEWFDVEPLTLTLGRSAKMYVLDLDPE